MVARGSPSRAMATNRPNPPAPNLSPLPNLVIRPIFKRRAQPLPLRIASQIVALFLVFRLTTQAMIEIILLPFDAVNARDVPLEIKHTFRHVLRKLRNQMKMIRHDDGPQRMKFPDRPIMRQRGENTVRNGAGQGTGFTDKPGGDGVFVTVHAHGDEMRRVRRILRNRRWRTMRKCFSGRTKCRFVCFSRFIHERIMTQPATFVKKGPAKNAALVARGW